jgi:hypothetical protein
MARPYATMKGFWNSKHGPLRIETIKKSRHLTLVMPEFEKKQHTLNVNRLP